MGSSSILETSVHRFDEHVHFVRCNRLGQPREWQLIHQHWEDFKKSDYPQVFQRNETTEKSILQHASELKSPLQALIPLSQQIDLEFRDSLTIFGRVTNHFECVEGLAAQGVLLYRTFNDQCSECQSAIGEARDKLVQVNNKLQAFKRAKRSLR